MSPVRQKEEEDEKEGISAESETRIERLVQNIFGLVSLSV